jgi:hypothetical protein
MRGHGATTQVLPIQASISKRRYRVFPTTCEDRRHFHTNPNEVEGGPQELGDGTHHFHKPQRLWRQSKKGIINAT